MLGRRAVLDLWKDPWPLDVAQCPCDVHFTDWVRDCRLRNASIFHFGTGDHHHVGKTLALDGSGSAVLGITATRPEYKSYMDLVVAQPAVGRRYKVLFSDIYQLEPRLLPEFDIVNLFHLCEFWSETNAPFATLDDAGVLRAMAAKVKRGGRLMFYTGSFAYGRAEMLADSLLPELGFGPATRHESLRIHARL